LNNFEVRVGNVEPLSAGDGFFSTTLTNPLCKYVADTMGPGQFNVTCDTPGLSGRFVTIQIVNDVTVGGGQAILTICEVQAVVQQINTTSE
jgi:hypothetical protein